MPLGKTPACVLIAETECSGHHLVYVRLLVEAALRRGDSVVFATTARVLSDERFLVHMRDLQDLIRIIPIDEDVSLERLQELGLWSAFKNWDRYSGRMLC